MLKLVRCEFLKLKRKKFVLFIVLSACILPIPLTAIVLKSGIGQSADHIIPPEEMYDGLFGMLVGYGNYIAMPCIIGIVAAMLFYMERDNDTLKNLRTIPVSTNQIVAAKIVTLFILGIFYSIALVASSMIGGLIGGGINGVGYKLWISVLTGVLLTAGTLPVVIAIVFFNRSYIFSILLSLVYSTASFGITVSSFTAGNFSNPLISVLPVPLIWRWQNLALQGAAAGEAIKRAAVPLPVVVSIVGLIAVLSIVGILFIYRKRES